MIDFVIALVGFVICMYLIARFGPQVHAFRFSEYALLLALPLFAVITYAVMFDIRVIPVFLASAGLGAAAEYGFGRMYHHMMGIRLWRYWKYSIGGYTSLLAVPLWGTAGVFFYILAEAFR